MTTLVGLSKTANESFISESFEVGVTTFVGSMQQFLSSHFTITINQSVVIQ